jgi:transposase
METAAAYGGNEIIGSPILFLAFELSNKKWKLGFTPSLAQKPRERTIPARELGEVAEEIAAAKQRFGLPESTRVVSCYEAGRDGFYLHRYLVSIGVENLVVDSASIAVNRRHRQAKTDRLDLGKLLVQLIRHHSGERKVWSVVRVPSVEQEDYRQIHRELGDLKAERAREVNRAKGLLAAQGISVQTRGKVPVDLEELRLWDGRPLPEGLKERVQRTLDRVQWLSEQIEAIEKKRAQELAEACAATAEEGEGVPPTPEHIEMVRALLLLRGIGPNTAWLWVTEFFGWRAFRNRREVGALAGLTPTPFASGDSNREQGISKAGNSRVRTRAIEMAWLWLRYQPQSRLSLWYQARFGQGNSRQRRVGIVALARKLLISVWKYLSTGEIPEGAIVKV